MANRKPLIIDTTNALVQQLQSGDVLIDPADDAYTTAAAIFGTDDVLLASDGTGVGIKATSIDKDTVVTAAAVFDTDEKIILADGTGRGVQSAVDGTNIKHYTATTNESSTLGSNLVDATGWTSVGWTGDFNAGFTHTVGNTNALSEGDLTPTVDEVYRITWTVTGRTAGSFTVSFGGRTSTAQTATGTYDVSALTTGQLSFTPTTDFDGTISAITVKLFTAYDPCFSFIGSNDLSCIEFRSQLRAGNNTCIGLRAGQLLEAGTSNVAIGANAGRRITTGAGNFCFGSSAGRRITSGGSNVLIGANSGLEVHDTNGNVGIGSAALQNTVAASNVGIGTNAGQDITTGNNNIFIGASAGDNASQLATVANSIAIGQGTFTTADNTGVLGNTSMTVWTINGSAIINEQGLDQDTRVEGDTRTHMIFVDASAATENIALVATAAPNWQSMDGGLFIEDATTAPSGNPSSGVFLYSSSGDLIVRNTQGAVTTLSGETRGATGSVADGGTITHNLGTTPTGVVATGSVAGEIVSVTALGATTFTVAIKLHDGTAGTSQTIYWKAFK